MNKILTKFNRFFKKVIFMKINKQKMEKLNIKLYVKRKLIIFQ
jgi:hypothetical protein